MNAIMGVLESEGIQIGASALTGSVCSTTLIKGTIHMMPFTRIAFLCCKKLSF